VKPAADGCDQKHQHGSVGDRLERQAIEKQANRRDDQQRQADVEEREILASGEPVGQSEDRHGHEDVDRKRPRDQRGVQ